MHDEKSIYHQWPLCCPPSAYSASSVVHSPQIGKRGSEKTVDKLINPIVNIVVQSGWKHKPVIFIVLILLNL
jgi:hypothetical protein